MKHIIITTIAAVVLVGCGESQQTSPQSETGSQTAPINSIHDAAKRGDIEAVKQYLADNANVNSKDSKGMTPLHAAAIRNHKEIAQLLIAKGADVNAKTIGQQTPMHAAAYNGYRNIIELLIEHGADVNSQIKLSGSFNNMTPLDFDLVYSHGKNSELLIEHGGITGAKPDTTIHEAAEHGRSFDLKHHLIAGADINARDENGMTPIHLAVKHGHKAMTELLIAKGAHLNAKTKPKDHSPISESQKPQQGSLGFMPVEIPETPLDLTTVDYGFDSPEEKAVKKEIAGLLRKHGGKYGSFLSALRNNDIDAVREFLSNGTDVNAKDEFGDITPLLIAGGSNEMFELLIANGADVNAQLGNGWTLLHQTARFGNIETAELLIANGADVNSKVDTGLLGAMEKDTPLFVAEYHSQKEMADLLRKYGGKIGHELKADDSLHIAAQYGKLELVKKHLAAGADVNEVDVMGMTPLHAACAGGNDEIVSLLAEKGAYINAKITIGRPDEITPLQKLGQGRLTGMTPLHMAATKEIAEILIAKGAELNVTVTFGPLKGNTPLDGFAGSNDAKHAEIADLLRKHGGKTGEELKAEGT
jgi:ankyrin repeat protein